MKTWATFPSRPLQSEPRSGVAGVVFEPRLRSSRGVAESSGFSLHAGLAAKASQRDKLDRLARYVSRPPVATGRLALTGSGHVRYTLKTPYRDGTTHVIFEPEDFIARLAALVPKPRAHLTRYHGVFAPASPDRAQIVPSARAIDCYLLGIFFGVGTRWTRPCLPLCRSFNWATISSTSPVTTVRFPCR